MGYDHYDMNIENWANSIIELEESHYSDASHTVQLSPEKGALVSLSMPTYYRTKAFSSNVGINSLINAADPLLTLATKLRKVTIPPDVTILHQNICHEINAFENKAQTIGYRSQMILAARYVICALLDELIAISLWPDLGWKKFRLVETFHKDSWEEDRFFIILNRSLQSPSEHIDLLELIYLCLRLGYEGKYREIERGLFELRDITEHLYHVISIQREEFSRGLLISSDNIQLHQTQRKMYSHLLPSLWVISTVMIFSLIIVFLFFYFKLIESASPVTKILHSLESTQAATPISSTTSN